MATATAHSAQLAQGTWKVDQLHSEAAFQVRHFGLTWLRGRFDEFDVNLSVDENGELQLLGSAPVSKIGFPNDMLAGHLQSPEFFDAQLHPEISFSASDVALEADGQCKVGGELTIKGTTKPVTLEGTWSGPIVDPFGNDRVSLELSGDIDRFDYGVSWSSNLPKGGDVLGRKVRLQGSFELVRN